MAEIEFSSAVHAYLGNPNNDIETYVKCIISILTETGWLDVDVSDLLLGFNIDWDPEGQFVTAGNLTFSNPEGQYSPGSDPTVATNWITTHLSDDVNPAGAWDYNHKFHVVYERDGCIYYQYTTNPTNQTNYTDITWSSPVQLTSSGNDGHPGIAIKKGTALPVLVFQRWDTENLKYDIYIKDEADFLTSGGEALVKTDRQEPCVIFDADEDLVVFCVKDSVTYTEIVYYVREEPGAEYNVERTVPLSSLGGIIHNPSAALTNDWRIILAFDRRVGASDPADIYVIKTKRDYQQIATPPSIINISPVEVVALYNDEAVENYEFIGITGEVTGGIYSDLSNTNNEAMVNIVPVLTVELSGDISP